jgi:hypothetical protein
MVERAQKAPNEGIDHPDADQWMSWKMEMPVVVLAVDSLKLPQHPI